MTDYFEASLTYQEPPNGIFSPQFPVIGGSGCNGQLHSGDKEKLYLELKFLRKVENIESVTLSLIGKRTNQYYRIISDDNITFSTLLDILRKFELPKLTVQIFSKKAELFRHTQNLFNYKNDEVSMLSGDNRACKNHFEKDEILKLKFDEFRFPYERRQLPSTFSYFNFSWRLRTKYYLKVEVIRSGTLIKCKYVPYELKYQSGFYNKFKTNITTLIHKDILIASHKHVFRRRPKKYYMNNCEQRFIKI
ncbi:unnamed protein product [[Candida] boidinii]|nr:unnamed protein product [[Candida] boidinii]